MAKFFAALGVTASLVTGILLSATPSQAGCRYVLLPNGQQVMSCTKN